MSSLTIRAKPVEIRNSFQALAERDILDSDGQKATLDKSLGEIMKIKTRKPKGGKSYVSKSDGNSVGSSISVEPADNSVSDSLSSFTLGRRRIGATSLRMAELAETQTPPYIQHTHMSPYVTKITSHTLQHTHT